MVKDTAEYAVVGYKQQTRYSESKWRRPNSESKRKILRNTPVAGILSI